MLLNNSIKYKYKTWQFWFPKLKNLNFEIRALVSLDSTRRYRKTIRPILKVSYLDNEPFTYLTPPATYVALVPTGTNRKLILFQTLSRSTLSNLKPYINFLSLVFLGFVFRFKLFLRLRGLGYKVYTKEDGKIIIFKLGFSHLVTHRFRFGIFAKVLGIKDRMFSIEGNSWLMLTTMSARLQKLKKIDVYRGKGIFKKFYTYKIKQNRKKKKIVCQQVFNFHFIQEEDILEKKEPLHLEKDHKEKVFVLEYLQCLLKNPTLPQEE